MKILMALFIVAMALFIDVVIVQSMFFPERPIIDALKDLIKEIRTNEQKRL